MQRPERPKSPRLWFLLRCAIMAAVGLGVLGPATAAPPYELIGREAPDFTLHALVGGNVRLSEHRGEVVVISFWSSYCSLCRAQLAALDRSLDTYHAAGLQMYGIDVDDNLERAAKAGRTVNVSFALLLDPQKVVSRSYRIDNLPMTVLIDRNGMIRYALRDYSEKSEGLYLQQLRILLDE